MRRVATAARHQRCRRRRSELRRDREAVVVVTPYPPSSAGAQWHVRAQRAPREGSLRECAETPALRTAAWSRGQLCRAIEPGRLRHEGGPAHVVMVARSHARIDRRQREAPSTRMLWLTGCSLFILSQYTRRAMEWRSAGERPQMSVLRPAVEMQSAIDLVDRTGELHHDAVRPGTERAGDVNELDGRELALTLLVLGDERLRLVEPGGDLRLGQPGFAAKPAQQASKLFLGGRAQSVAHCGWPVLLTAFPSNPSFGLSHFRITCGRPDECRIEPIAASGGAP